MQTYSATLKACTNRRQSDDFRTALVWDVECGQRQKSLTHKSAPNRSDHRPNSNYRPSRANAVSTPRIPTRALHIELPRPTSCNCASDAFTQFSSAFWLMMKSIATPSGSAPSGKNRGLDRLSSQFARSILQQKIEMWSRSISCKDLLGTKITYNDIAAV